MTRTIAVANQKGGVGKTTTAVNLAAMIALSGKNVLLFDLDPQGNATTGLGVKKLPEGGATALFAGKKTFDAVVSETRWAHLFVVPANSALTRFDGDNDPVKPLADRMRNILAEATEHFDYIFVDCPPSLSRLPRLAFSICGSVIIPIQAEFFSMEGLSQMIRVLENERREGNKELEVEGILFTMFDHRLRFANEVVEDVRGYFGEKVFRNMIPRDVAIPESSSFGLPVLEYDPFSRGARGYVELAKEVL